MFRICTYNSQCYIKHNIYALQLVALACALNGLQSLAVYASISSGTVRAAETETHLETPHSYTDHTKHMHFN